MKMTALGITMHSHTYARRKQSGHDFNKCNSPTQQLLAHSFLVSGAHLKSEIDASGLLK